MGESPEQGIVRSIIEAVSEQRLPPGTKLGEQELSEIFSCNRANVRRALAALAVQHVVDLRPNRGAFVASPTEKEARDVFQARRALERTIARQAAVRVSQQDIDVLRAMVEQEQTARDAGDQPLELRLSRDFHLYLAKIADNAVLEGFLQELTMRSTLIIGLYSADRTSGCARDEHARIVDALESRDPERLAACMDEHLRHLEDGIAFGEPKAPVSGLHGQLLRRS